MASSGMCARPDPGTGRPGAQRAVARWFGPPDRPLFGWVHLPASGRARGAVVLCPPLGKEMTTTYSTYRRLAEQLAARGLVAVRFAYDGTGDAAGDDHDPGRVAAWLSSIDHAVVLARTTGAPAVSLAGMRAGALLAAWAAASMPDVDQLVLWDPVPSGRAFLREGRAMALLHAAGVRTPDVAQEASSDYPPGTDLPGWYLRADTAEDLRALGPPAQAGRQLRRLLVLVRSSVNPPAELLAAFPGAEATWGRAEGQEQLLDVHPLDLVYPEASAAEVVEWLVRGSTGPAAAVECAPRPAATIRSGGTELREQAVTLGSQGIFGVLTLPAPDALRPETPWVLFLNSGNDHHVGPCRLWVRMARAWAAAGFPCARIDLSGIGDSPARPDQVPDSIRHPGAFDDVEEVAAAVSPDDPSNVVLVGMCAGGYQALESPLGWRHGPPRAVYPVNPLLRFAPPEMAKGPMDRRRTLCRPAHPLSQSSRRLPAGVVCRGLWWALWCLGHPKILRKRDPMRPLVEAGVDVFCIGGAMETAQVRDALGAWSATGARTGAEVVTIPDLDHGLLIGWQRDLVVDLLTRHLLAGPLSPGPQPAQPTSPPQEQPRPRGMGGVPVDGMAP